MQTFKTFLSERVSTRPIIRLTIDLRWRLDDGLVRQYTMIMKKRLHSELPQNWKSSIVVQPKEFIIDVVNDDTIDIDNVDRVVLDVVFNFGPTYANIQPPYPHVMFNHDLNATLRCKSGGFILDVNKTMNRRQIGRRIEADRMMIDVEAMNNVVGLLWLFDVKDLDTVSGSNQHGTVSGFRLIDALNIVSKHLLKGRDVMACQEELIDSGFEEYAEF